MLSHVRSSVGFALPRCLEAFRRIHNEAQAARDQASQAAKELKKDVGAMEVFDRCALIMDLTDLP